MSAEEKTPAEEITTETLLAPIPLLSLSREVKLGYREYPIDKSSPLFNEELVDTSEYGLAGQAYYSRPNAGTSQPVAEVQSSLWLRKTLAVKLREINVALKKSEVIKFFGGPVELYIEDAYRSPELQMKLYEQVFPRLVRQQSPEIPDEELEKKLNNLIAIPSDDPEKPSPHATGGAVDVILRYVQNSLGYVPEAQVPMGHADGETSDRILPDYFESAQPDTDEDKMARRNRRAFYALMTGKALGMDTELQVNPTEWWHWSYGDQMWAKLRHKPAAIYGLSQRSRSQSLR